MWGLANAVAKIDLVKVYADYELNHEVFDKEVSFSIERVKGIKLFQKYRKDQTATNLIPYTIRFQPYRRG